MLVILCCKLYFLQFIIRSFSYEWSCIMCMVIHVKKQDVILTFLSVCAENELFFRKSPFWKYGTRWNFGHWSIEGNKDKSIDHNVELASITLFTVLLLLLSVFKWQSRIAIIKGRNLWLESNPSEWPQLCSWRRDTTPILPSWISEIVLKSLKLFNSVHKVVSLLRFDV